MDRNPIMQAAEEAVKWANLPCHTDPSITNYERLMLDALHAARSTDAGAPIMLQMRSMATGHWACLSRLLLMDKPELVRYIHPHFIAALDDQSGATWMQHAFVKVVGRHPEVRSWRHIKDAAIQ